MQLENLAYEARSAQTQRQQVYFVVGDLETLSASALYTGEPCGSHGGFSGGIRPTSRGFIIPIGKLGIPELDDIHETYKIDSEGNLSYGHTTFVSKKDKKRISHD